MDVLIVIYRSLNVGGIEANTYDMITNALKRNKRVIWICDVKRFISPVYSDVLNHPNFSEVRVNMSGANPWTIPKLDIDSKSRIVVLSFSYFHLFYGFSIRKKYSSNPVSVFFITPHFVGPTVFPEEAFQGWGARKVRDRLSKQFKLLDQANSLRFFAPRHIDVIEKKYKIKIDNSNSKLYPKIKDRERFSVEDAEKRWEQKPHIIVSAGRLEFPHKGYVIGLIKDFVHLKKEYPDLELHIYGDGPNENELSNQINSIKTDYSNCGIIRHHSIPFEELMAVFKKCWLNISVAGCASSGAAMGLITLPARHYCYDCEVYGFFPESKNQTTESKPGTPAIDYIKEVISMDKETYVKYSKAAYDSFNEDYNNIRVDYPFDEPNDISYMPSRGEFFFVKVVYALQRIKYVLSKIKR